MTRKTDARRADRGREAFVKATVKAVRSMYDSHFRRLYELYEDGEITDEQLKVLIERA